MKKAYIFLAEGFEEMEAVTPLDLLSFPRSSSTIFSPKGMAVAGPRDVTTFPSAQTRSLEGYGCWCIVLW